MAGGKLTPRQKMINMMYLVLTAMLALNVSAEILDAFAKIEKGLEQTILITEDQNTHTLTLFDDAVATMGKKAEEWRKQANLTRQKAKEVSDYIRNLKIELIQSADGRDTPGVDTATKQINPDGIEAMDDRETVNHIMLGTSSNGKAYDLKKKVEEYKSFLLEHVATDPTISNKINGLLDFEVSHKGIDVRDWETFTFHEAPLISAVAMLSKLQVDVLNCESSILDYLKSQIGREDIKISNIAAAVSNPDGVIMRGASGEAEVFLAAVDESIEATAHWGGGARSMTGGKIKIPFSGHSIGPNVVSGYITYKDGVGETQRRDFKFEYHVVEPALAVSPTKMNVFYLGVDNPVDISVSGVKSDVHVSMSNGSITHQSGASYIVKPAGMGKCVISVTANINGETKNMGSREFRVKRVPLPEPSLYNAPGKEVSRGFLSGVQGVVAKMPDDFDFDLKYTVVSFTIGVIDQNGYYKSSESKSQRFTDTQRQLMASAKPGSRLFISDIRAQGPDGTRSLGEVSYIIQ
jgi:gliding motility-associated protein GldM